LLFTQFSIISFKDTGPIGDTIGGITAPFINLLAAFLVYKSFKAQVESNNRQILAMSDQKTQHNQQINLLQKETTYNYINHLSNHLIDSFNASNNGGDKEFFQIPDGSLVANYNQWLYDFIKKMDFDSNYPSPVLGEFIDISKKMKHYISTLLFVVEEISIAYKDNDSLKKYFSNYLNEYINGTQFFEGLEYAGIIDEIYEANFYGNDNYLLIVENKNNLEKLQKMFEFS